MRLTGHARLAARRLPHAAAARARRVPQARPLLLEPVERPGTRMRHVRPRDHEVPRPRLRPLGFRLLRTVRRAGLPHLRGPILRRVRHAPAPALLRCVSGDGRLRKRKFRRSGTEVRPVPL
jgi:hypothetical protein